MSVSGLQKSPTVIEAAYTLSSDEIFKILSTSKEGLSDEEAAHRAKIYGLNKLSEKKKVSALSLYFRQFKNTLTLVLIGAALLILFIYFFGEREPSDLIESALILGIILMITLLGFIQEYKAEKAVESLKKLLAFKAKVIRNGTEKEVDVQSLVPGDVVVLEEGEKIPADIRLIQAFNLSTNEASLTGESTTVSKNDERIEEKKEIGDQKNMIFSGTTITNGRGIGVVINTGDSTEIGKIAGFVADSENEDTPIQKRLDRIGKIIGFSVLGISIGVFCFIVFFAGELSHQTLLSRIIHSFIAAVALAVAAIPEGLPAVVTISLALGTQRMLRKNALVRKLNSIETLGSTDVICSDKTGTLTKGEMTVRQIYFDGTVYEITGRGFETEGEIQKDGHKIDPTPLSLLFQTGLYSNNSRLEKDGTYFGDPTEVALLVSAAKSGIKSEYTRIFEIPFTSERRMMSVIVKDEKTNTFYLFSKGAPEVMIEKSAMIVRDEKEEKLDDKKREEIVTTNLGMSSKALRTLGFAYRRLTKEEVQRIKNNNEDLEKDLLFLGLQGMIDPPREEVKDLIKACQTSGIRVLMITGDHVETAKAVAREIGIGEEAIDGTTLEKMSEADFESTVNSINVYARISPGTKMRIIGALKKKGHIVAMTGDGVNDAPALKKADIGVAMGIKGTDVSKEASDMVLLDDNFSTIVSAIEEGRGIFQNIKKFVHYLLSCNVGEALTVLVAVILFRDIPLTATMLLWVNVVTDGLPAIALGLDPAQKKIMKLSPKEFQSDIVDRKTWIEMAVFGVLFTIGVLAIYALNLPEGNEEAKGAAFTATVVFQLVNVYIIRRKYNTSFRSNKWLFLAVLTSASLQLLLLYVPFLSFLFGISSIDTIDWIWIAIGSVLLWILFRVVRIVIDDKPLIATADPSLPAPLAQN